MQSHSRKENVIEAGSNVLILLYKEDLPDEDLDQLRLCKFYEKTTSSTAAVEAICFTTSRCSSLIPLTMCVPAGPGVAGQWGRCATREMGLEAEWWDVCSYSLLSAPCAPRALAKQDVQHYGAHADAMILNVLLPVVAARGYVPIWSGLWWRFRGRVRRIEKYIVLIFVSVLRNVSCMCMKTLNFDAKFKVKLMLILKAIKR